MHGQIACMWSPWVAPKADPKKTRELGPRACARTAKPREFSSCEEKRVTLKQSRACRLAFLVSEVSLRPPSSKEGYQLVAPSPKMERLSQRTSTASRTTKDCRGSCCMGLVPPWQAPEQVLDTLGVF